MPPRRNYKAAKKYGAYTKGKYQKYTPKYPRYRQLTPINTIYPFERSVEYDVYLDLTSGFNGRGNGMSVTWSLASMLVTAGDLVQYFPTVPGASELTALFDQWRIDKVETLFLWSAGTTFMAPATAGSSSSANNLVQPIINVVTDYDDNSPNSVLSEYPSCRIMQLGTTNGSLQKHTIYKPGSMSVTEITGAGVTAIGDVSRGKWHDCDVSDVAHNCLKFAYTPFNPAGSYDFSVNQVCGCLKLRSKIFYSFKNPR